MPIQKIALKILVMLALLLSFITAFLVYSYLQGLSTKNMELVPVVIAKLEILPKIRITTDMVELIYVPADYTQPGVLQDINKVINVIARDQIVAGEQITEQRLAVDRKSFGFAGDIPSGKRAMSVAVNEVSGVAGLIKIGDNVDVVATFEQNVAGAYVGYIVLQNLPILAVNQETAEGNMENISIIDKKEALKGTTVTLAVTPEEAGRLALAADKGKIFMALRSCFTEAANVIATPVTPSSILGILAPTKQPAPPDSIPQQASPQVYPEPLLSVKQDVEGGIMVVRGSKIERVQID